MPRKCYSPNPAICVEYLVQFAYRLSSSELDELIAALLALQSAIAQNDSEPIDSTISISNHQKREGKSAHIAWKTINGCGPYPYLRFREGKKYRSYYLKELRKEHKR